VPLLKKISHIGNSLGLILDRPVCEMIGIDEDTVVELIAEGGALVVRPVKAASVARVRASARKVMKAHRSTLKRLATS